MTAVSGRVSPADEAISVVVPTRDRPEMLRRCLASLRRTITAEDELIVVDSASRDPAIPTVAASGGARYLRLDRPGVSVARNLGWRKAAHDVVCFVDDDLMVGEGWAEVVRAAFRLRPELGFVTGRVEAPPGQEDAEHPVAIVSGDEPQALQRGAARYLGISGNLAVRRGHLERVAGFDEALGPGARLRGGGEDLDLFDRLLAAGAVGRYEPSAQAFHEQWRSKRERLALDYGYGAGAGARLAKLVRTDRRHARTIATEILWRWGVRDLAVCMRRGYEYGALAALMRLAGMVRGILAGLAVPVRDGHFAPQRRRRPTVASDRDDG